MQQCLAVSFVCRLLQEYADEDEPQSADKCPLEDIPHPYDHQKYGEPLAYTACNQGCLIDVPGPFPDNGPEDPPPVQGEARDEIKYGKDHICGCQEMCDCYQRGGRHTLILEVDDAPECP